MSRSMSKIKKVALPDLNIVDFNRSIIELLKGCQEEINYRIGDTDYTKNVQRTFLQAHPLFKSLEKQLIEYKVDLNTNLPLIPSQESFQKIISQVAFMPINRDIILLLSQLKSVNFQIIFTFVKMLFNDFLKSGRNNSSFIRKISEIVETQPESWLDLEKYGNNVVFFFLNLLVNSIEGMRVFVSESDILRKLDAKNVYCIYHKKSTFTSDGIKNLYQQLVHTNEEIRLENIPFIDSTTPKSEYEIYAYLVIDMRIKKTDLDCCCLPNDHHSQFLIYFYSLFHQPTITFLNERKHNYIYNNLFAFLNTFNLFLNAKIYPLDRMRYLLAGSVIKSAYNVRDCADVDFFVLDHEDNIESYSKYKPNTGIPDIFDDFGKTYYANEDYYLPMNPEMYEKIKTFKKKEDTSDRLITIMNNFPKYSVSGLKAGRYIDIYSGECKKIGYDIDNLDELVSNPNNRIYFLGCPVIQLKLEMIRDNIKDIDLERVSRKQLHDLHFLRTNYEYLFSRTDFMEFGLDRFRESKDKIRKNKINLAINIYHKELVSDDKVGFDLVIRRIPLYIEEITAKLIKEGPLLISKDNEIVSADSRLTYQKPMLSSLPATVKLASKREIPVIYYYELSSLGELHIYVNQEGEETDVSFFSDVCITGNLKVEQSEGNKKILISISGNKMKNIFSQIPGQEKKYKLLLINFMKNLVQMHKMIDCHTKDRITIDLLK